MSGDISAVLRTHSKVMLSVVEAEKGEGDVKR